MRYLVSGKEMKQYDQNTTNKFHVPELVLMEQAAMAFTEKLLRLKPQIHTALIVCGSGNNGADGLAVARLLRERNIAVTLFLLGELAGQKTSASYEVQKEICTAYDIPVTEDISETGPAYDSIVDAVFGTGLSREVGGIYAEKLQVLNNMPGYHVSVDIASGICSDQGTVLGTAFRADDTITFSFAKKGQYLWPGNEYSGNVHVVPIGITEESFLNTVPKMVCCEKEDLRQLPARVAHSNKGTYGKLLVIAGSKDMAGAAYFCAKAAYASGTGLVRVVTPEENRQILQIRLPEAVLVSVEENQTDELVQQLAWADAIVLGPGIGTMEYSRRLVKTVLEHCRKPLVLDADALNILAEEPELLNRKDSTEPVIVTPHLGEMSRLTHKNVAQIQQSLEETACTFAEQYNKICVLKDFHTVTALPDGSTFLNLSGNNGMATAGSGDVLAGIIGALLAQGMPAAQAAPLGVYIHGLAGDAAKEKCGVRALCASDIIEGLKEVDRS